MNQIVKKTVMAAVAVAACCFGTVAETPATIAGKWVSAPVESWEGNKHTVTTYTLDFLPGSKSADVEAVEVIKGLQMGSKEMKVNVVVEVKGTAFWSIANDNLTLKFVQGDPKASIDPAKVELDVPEAMKKAMAVRMDEFLAGITGSIQDNEANRFAQQGVTFESIDVNTADPDRMTARDGHTVVTFSRSK